MANNTEAGELSWGIFVPHGGAGEFTGWPGPAAWTRMRESAADFDALGFDHLWVSDHLMASGTDRTGPFFEGYSTLAALTQVTTHARLGALVTCAYYRNAGMLAKQAASVDVMSDGRLIFALGGGWDETESLAYGYPFPTPGERVDTFAETLAAVALLWSEDVVTFNGSHVQLRGASCNPRPLRRPPVWTGTHGRRGLRIAAQHADVANWNVGLSDFRRLSAELARACREVGRNPSSIDTSVFRLAELSGDPKSVEQTLGKIGVPPEAIPGLSQDHFIGSPDQVAPRVQEFVDEGATHIVIMCLDSPSTNLSAERFYHGVIPQIRPRITH
ncbi:LLM class flavin-dependent oxidoreductase [Phytoactinopolyspora limicola]|uniref:LLM class flavin-dependent oxidoreductase n=1 Tax=Phytoactinopolyspora limicola TaxID=2715536 RepID=UPI00140DB246|nr:LLM class flavin-dependent oxidoreductase [Phytoactinopolyspora limicola]